MEADGSFAEDKHMQLCLRDSASARSDMEALFQPLDSLL